MGDCEGNGNDDSCHIGMIVIGAVSNAWVICSRCVSRRGKDVYVGFNI
jgi:hypothetical protein